MAAIPAAIGFVAAEGAFLSLPVFDPTQPIFGIDPLVMIGLATIAGAAGSYVAASALAGIVYRRLRPAQSFALDQVSLAVQSPTN